MNDGKVARGTGVGDHLLRSWGRTVCRPAQSEDEQEPRDDNEDDDEQGDFEDYHARLLLRNPIPQLSSQPNGRSTRRACRESITAPGEVATGPKRENEQFGDFF